MMSKGIERKIKTFKAQKQGFLKGAKEIAPDYLKDDYHKKLFNNFEREMKNTIEFCDYLLKDCEL